MVIYSIPGLGTTKELYKNIKIKGVEIIVLDWPLPEASDNMQSYAKKFLPQINTSQPFCLMGVSFGGMICSELSQLISAKKTFLVSTCKMRNELPWFIRALNYIPLHKIISEKQHRKMAYEGRWFIGFGRAYIPEYLGMINSMAKNYFKYCINIIVSWKQKQLPKNFIHLHGDNDRLLLYNCVKATHTIKNGSHAMVVFQAEEISKIIELEIEKINA